MDWKPTKITFPQTTTDDYLKQAITDIATILQQRPQHRNIQLTYGDTTNNAWVTLADMLARAAVKPQHEPPNNTHAEQRVKQPSPCKKPRCRTEGDEAKTAPHTSHKH
jgi:hypothetical protein